jgi:hypothetical protein
MAEVINGILGDVAKWAEDSENIDMITGGIKSTFEFIGELMSPLIEGFTLLAEGLLPVIQSIFEFIQPIVISIAGFIGDIVGSVGSLITKLKEGNGGFSTMEKTIGIIAAAVAGFYGTIKLIQLGQLAINKATMIYEGIVAAVAFTKGLIAKMNKEEEMSLGRRILMGIRDAVVAGVKAVAQITGMSAATLGAAAGIALAAGAAAAVYFGSQESKMNDGAQGPVGGGYSRTMYGPEGSISFNDKDTIVAGTNLGGSGGNSGGGNSSAELGRIASLLEQLLNKEGGVYIDGNKVGGTIALTNYQQQ